jgi:hypothetical protein
MRLPISTGKKKIFLNEKIFIFECLYHKAAGSFLFQSNSDHTKLIRIFSERVVVIIIAQNIDVFDYDLNMNVQLVETIEMLKRTFNFINDAEMIRRIRIIRDCSLIWRRNMKIILCSKFNHFPVKIFIELIIKIVI